MRSTRIEHNEMEQFITHCMGEATRWRIKGIDFNSWCIKNNKSGEDAETEWLTEVVIPYLQRRFDYLELREDGRLFGFRNETDQELCPGFYNADSLNTCMVAECPGQGWKFALGCCRKRITLR